MIEISKLPVTTPRGQYWIEISSLLEGYWQAVLFEQEYEKNWYRATRGSKEFAIDSIMRNFTFPFGMIPTIHDV